MKNLCPRMLRHLLSGFAIYSLIASAVFIHAPQAAGQGTGYWTTKNGKIVDACGNVTKINGISWYGFETNNYVINDLWGSETYTQIMEQIKADGFNTIRIPFSNDMVEHNPPITNNLEADPELVGLTSLQILDKIVAEAGALGLKVILDNHRSEAQDPNGPFGYTGNEPNGLWYTNGFQGYLTTYTEQNWIQDWQTMVTRYAGPNTTFVDANGNPTVIGVDIRNEPHLQQTLATSYTSGTTTAWGGSCWTGDTTSQTGDNSPCPTSNLTNNWPAAAARGGNAVLAINPNLLIFVQGVDVYDNSYSWAGGNLQGAAANPVTLNYPAQLVYSAHDYGPEEYAQSFLDVTNSGTTANPYSSSLYTFWDTEWGNLTTGSNPVPVWLGEFGTQNVNPADYACYPAGTTCTTPYPAGASPDLQVLDPTTGSQGLWFNSLINYLNSNPVGENINWSYWALNEEDSDGLLNSTMTGVALPAKETALRSIQSPAFTGNMCPGPTDLTITGETSSSISFAWDAPATAIPNMQGYAVLWGAGEPNLVVPYNSAVEFEDAPYATGYIPATATSSAVGPIGLSATGTTYSFEVAAVEPGGVLSAPTNIATGTTDSIYGCTQPYEPANFTATAVSSSEIDLSWTADPLAQLGPENTPCTLQYLPFSVPAGEQNYGGDVPGEQYPISSILGSTTGTTYAVTGLDPSTQYCYSLEAVLQNPSQSEGSPYFPESFQVNAICATTAASSTSAANVTYTVTSTSTSPTEASTQDRRIPEPGPRSYFAGYERTGWQAESDARNRFSERNMRRCWTPAGLNSDCNFEVRSAVFHPRQGFYARPWANTASSASNTEAGDLMASTTGSTGTTSAFQASITITDESGTPINNWTASFSFPGSQTITSVWDATATQSGSVVTLTNAGYNSTIPANGSVSGIGFDANGAAATPTFITVNGRPASINGVKPTVAPIVPAPAPTALSATLASGTTVQLIWSAVAPAPATPSISYQVYRSTTSGFTPGVTNLIASGLTTPAYTDSNLAVSTTYYYVVAAADAVGSAGYSPQATATTQAQPNYCHVAYAVSTSWPSGSTTDFQSSVTIDNIGKTALSSWTIGWQFPNTSTSITPGDVWNGNLLTNSGGKESISNVSYNGSIPAGGSYTFSFQGSYTGTSANPTAFTVNGVACQ